MLVGMIARSKLPPWLLKVIVPAVRLVIIGAILGFIYTWASPFAYPKNRALGFWHGCLHGGLMPMALPSLIAGQNVDIFAANNNGRFYKLGYICGINLCGVIFFGASFANVPSKETRGKLRSDQPGRQPSKYFGEEETSAPAPSK